MKETFDYVHENTTDDLTEQFRSALSFLMFIETKLINKQVYRIASTDMDEIDGFSKFMTAYMPE